MNIFPEIFNSLYRPDPTDTDAIATRDSAGEVIATSDAIYIDDSLMGLQISPVLQQALP